MEKKCYSITYTETYSRTYDVIADSPEEAKEKLDSAIRDGLEGPDECIDSSLSVDKAEEISMSDLRYVDVL